MLKPRALQPGARLAVVSPASPFDRDELLAGVAELRALGFDPVVDPRVFERVRYESGPPEMRAEVLHDALRDPEVAGIIGARGGYGSVHVLPYLDGDLVARARKPIVGYSDLTTLLQFVTLRCGLVGFHGPTVAGRFSAGPGAYDRESFLGALMRPEPLGELRPPTLEAIREGEAAGPLLGGTLTQLCASLGTPFAFDPPGGFVLFLEDVNERPYRIDRMLTQLRLAGVLGRASGIVFGEMRGCDESPALTAREVVMELLNDLYGPVLWGFPSGHTTGPAWTLPLGVRARVVGDPFAPALVIEESAVE